MLERADALALRSRLPELAALCLNYLAIVRVEAGEPDGLQTMRNSIALAQAGAHHEATARGYCNLAELLLRHGAARRARALRARGPGLHARARVLVARLQPRGPPLPAAAAARGLGRRAEAGLRQLLDANADPGMLFAYSAPWLGRLLARRGDRAAGKLLADAWQHAQRGRLVLGLAYAGIARAEWAWLTGDIDAARAGRRR